MRKLAFALLSATAIYGLTGCALTDYCNNTACSDRLTENGIDGRALGCSSAQLSFQGDPQRPTCEPPLLVGGPEGPCTSAEIWTPQVADVDDPLDPLDPFFLRCGDRTLPLNRCQTNGTFGPPGGSPDTCTSSGPVSLAEAATWEDQLGVQMFFGEAQVFSPASLLGTYVLAGVKSLGTVCDPNTGLPIGGGGGGGGAASGAASATSGPVGGPAPVAGWKTIRINNFFSPDTGAFTCVGSAIDGIYGSPETTILGDQMSVGRIPGLKIDSVTLDNAPNAEFNVNLRAVSSFRHTQGFSTFWGILGRAYEGRHEFVLPTATNGLASLMTGDHMNITIPTDNATVVVGAMVTMTAEGGFRFDVDSLAYNESVYNFPRPLRFEAGRNFRTWKVGVEGQNDLASYRALSDWAKRTIPAAAWEKGFMIPKGGVIPERGITIQQSIGAKINPFFFDQLANANAQNRPNNKQGGAARGRAR